MSSRRKLIPAKTQEDTMKAQIALVGLLSLSAIVLTMGPVLAHGGGLDAHGCHHDRKNGGYHCHQGPLSGKYFVSKSDMLTALEAMNQPPQDLPQRIEASRRLG
jgi:hypothetical protein